MILPNLTPSTYQTVEVKLDSIPEGSGGRYLGHVVDQVHGVGELAEGHEPAPSCQVRHEGCKQSQDLSFANGLYSCAFTVYSPTNVQIKYVIQAADNKSFNGVMSTFRTRTLRN